MTAQGGDRENLVLAAQTGKPAATARLLAVCQADARRYAAYRHCQLSDIADAVQKSVQVISRKVKGLKAAAFSSCLFTVIKRECRKLERAVFKHDPLPDELAEARRNSPRSPTMPCASTWPTPWSRGLKQVDIKDDINDPTARLPLIQARNAELARFGLFRLLPPT